MNEITRAEYTSNQTALWKEIGRLGAKLEGPPHPGLESRVDTFITEFRTLEKERDDNRAKQHKANITRLNIIIAALTCIAGYLAIFHH